MNELRMYVEHLFEGKVLTPENIELKEEIYGNLVARYEDLVASGVDAAEALRRTKESFTSVDDVLAAEGAEPVAAVDEGVSESPAAAVDAPPADETAQMPDAEPTRTMPTAAGGPVPPEGVDAAAPTPGAAGAPRRRKVWPWVLGGCGALVLIAIVSVAVFGVTVGNGVLAGFTDRPGGRIHVDGGDDGSVTIDSDGVKVEGNAGNGQGIVNTDEAWIVEFSDGTILIDGEVGDRLVNEVVSDPNSDVLPYVNTGFADVNAIDALLLSLPMGEWATNLDVTRGNGVLRFDYVGVPDYFDGDSIDAALAYNVTALFCAVPDANKIQLTISESDEVNDHDCYVFSRSVLEDMYGVPLNADMVNEAGWKQIKNDNLYRDGFAERMLDFAESEGR